MVPKNTIITIILSILGSIIFLISCYLFKKRHEFDIIIIRDLTSNNRIVPVEGIIVVEGHVNTEGPSVPELPI
tara:strand:- start:275 stop:493 length:219 start_codon:yes stop_codon:yes gene_type:complete